MNRPSLVLLCLIPLLSGTAAAQWGATNSLATSVVYSGKGLIVYENAQGIQVFSAVAHSWATLACAPNRSGCSDGSAAAGRSIHLAAVWHPQSAPPTISGHGWY